MTDEEYQTLVEQVNANTQAIEEIKEVLAEMYEASEATSGNETLIQAMQAQIAELTTAQLDCRTQCDNNKTRIDTLEEETSTNTNGISALEAQYQEILERLTALESGLSSCSCEEMWANLYNKDLAKFSLNGTTLNITLPNTEE